MQPTETKKSFNSTGLHYSVSNPNVTNRNTLKITRDLAATTSSSYAYLHKKPKFKKDSYGTNRPSYLQTKIHQVVYPQTYHRFDESWKPGRKYIPEGNTLGAQIARLSNSLGHTEPNNYRHSDLLIPNNRKKMSVKMENVKLRNPILEDETDRLRSSSLENWATERRQRDNGVYTRLTMRWKY